MFDNDKLRRVTFDGHECSVVFVDLFASDYFEICLMDVATEKFTHCCTEPMAGVPLKERQVLIRDEFVELLADAGVVEPTGEAFDIGRDGRLHKCDVPVRERVP